MHKGESAQSYKQSKQGVYNLKENNMKHIFLLVMIVVVVFSCSSPIGEEVELVLDTKSQLGEGALWNYHTGELLWVDIQGEILNFYNPQTGNNKEMFTGQMIGTVVPVDDGSVLVALQQGIYSFDVRTGAKNLLVAPEKNLPTNRFNDGKCDPAGRFWVGTKSTVGEKNAGALYRYDGDTTIQKMVPDVSISNGIVWSLDATKMFYIDTPTRQVVQYDYDNTSGEIKNKKVVLGIPEDSGHPDGMTIDSEGNLWIALWGGFAVGCWNPATGELIKTIKVPAKNVTSCAFGDDDLATLYITTAREGNTAEELEKYPLSGGVFKTRPGVSGVKTHFFSTAN